jgi:hypothetical protein
MAGDDTGFVQGGADAPVLDAATVAYLEAAAFVRGFIEAGALRSAFELRVVDLLAARGTLAVEQLLPTTGADALGMRFLLDLLAANRVVVVRNGAVSLHPAFAAVLPFRELIESLIEQAFVMAGDYASLFSAAIADPQRFMRQARVFKVFDYGRCLESTPDNLHHTAGWLRLTTALTRHEARVCLDLHDFAPYRCMLDVGGNSGEFALQACRRHPPLQAVVADLPVVCELGLEHVLSEPEAARIAFLPLDARAAELPRGFDLISFKSMLHDWPADEARRFLAKAVAALEPGGSVLIFERGPLEVRGAAPAFALLPLLLFFRSYRSPALYVNTLRSLGMADVRCQHLQLDSPFFLVSARKPALPPA